MGRKVEDVNASSNTDKERKRNGSRRRPGASGAVLDEEKMVGETLKKLVNLDKQKKGDYARSQTSRNTKELSLNMSNVDWSGFPVAAHKKTPTMGDRKKQTNNIDRGGTGTVLASTALLDQRKQNAKKFSRSLSPGKSPVDSTAGVARLRSRRHLLSTGAIQAPNPPDGVATQREFKPTRGSVTDPEKRRRRTEPRSSEGRRGQRGQRILQQRAASQPRDSTSGHSDIMKLRTRRVQTEAQRRSLSPSRHAMSIQNRQSTSPKVKARRASAAAASAITLDIGEGQRNMSGVRGASRGRRKTKEKKTLEEDVERIQKTISQSFRW